MFAITALLAFAAGGLSFTSHEADMVHLVELVRRAAAGQVAHLDFMTPIGGWAVQPMALLLRAGLGLGAAMIGGQVLVSALLFLNVIRLAERLTLAQFTVLCLVTAGLSTGVVYGATDPLVSLSMHYNRWCWSATILVVLTVTIPGKHPGTRLGDGVVVGILMAGMALTKVTFAVALAIPVILILLRAGRRETLIASLVAASLLLLGVTLIHGIGFWYAYAGDLLAVTGSANRPMPSAPWPALILSPTGTPVTLVVLGGIWALMRAGRRDLGTALMLAYPAFVFITWQNFGNDPLWLVAVALILWVVSDGAQGRPRTALRAVALAAAVLILPVMLNIAYSPLRHLMLPRAEFREMLPGAPDLRMATARGQGAWVKQTMIAPPGDVPTVFRGRDLPQCELTGGLIAALSRDAAALLNMEPGLDRQPLVADLFSPHWLFAGLRPLQGGTPWYYDGLPGLADATHVMVPECPADMRARARILALLEDRGVALTEVGRTADFTLYRIAGQE